MSCAPRLISLSSSGKRNDSVSRESSVHSMMSMNCFLMKSRMAMLSSPLLGASALLLCRRGLLRIGLLQFGFELRQRQRARDHRAIGKDQRRRGVDVVFLPQDGGLRDRCGAVPLVVGESAGVEPVVPRLVAVIRAP